MDENPYSPPNEPKLNRDPYCITEYGAGFRLFVVILVLTAIALFVAGLIKFPFKSTSDVIGFSFAAAIMGSPAVWLVLECWFVQIVGSESGIVTTSPWRTTRHILWQEVTNVDYSASAMWYRVQTANQGAVRCHLFMSNVFPLLELVDQHSIPIVEGWEASKNRINQGIFSFTSPPKLTRRVTSKRKRSDSPDFSGLDD